MKKREALFDVHDRYRKRVEDYIWYHLLPDLFKSALIGARKNLYFANVVVRKQTLQEDSLNGVQRLRIKYLIFHPIKCFYLLRFHYLLNKFFGSSSDKGENVTVISYYEDDVLYFIDGYLGANYFIEDPYSFSINAGVYKSLSRVLVLCDKHDYTIDDYMKLLHLVYSRYLQCENRSLYQGYVKAHSLSMRLLDEYYESLKTDDGFSQLPLDWQWEMLSSIPETHE